MQDSDNIRETLRSLEQKKLLKEKQIKQICIKAKEVLEREKNVV